MAVCAAADPVGPGGLLVRGEPAWERCRACHALQSLRQQRHAWPAACPPSVPRPNTLPQAADIPLTAALLGGSSPHLLPVTSPHSGGSSLLGCDALLASPRDEASPRGRRKAAYREAVGAYSQGGSAVFIPALVRLRPT